MTDETSPPSPNDEETVSSYEHDDDAETLADPLSPPESDESRRPESIAGFRILGELGRGGMGVVWEAEQEHPKRRVALKVMRRDHVIDQIHIRMFRREAETLARLKHPNIAAIYESGHTDDGHDYFAMELVRGTTLDQWLASRPTRVDDAEMKLRLGLFRSICDAVHYAHQRGVIHRDLKPSNIIVSDPDVSSTSGTKSRSLPSLKILDFGLARITDSDIAATLVSEIGVIKGTLPYMSPEQARGDVAAIDLRSDVYALGVILYELLTGRRPYDVSRAALAEAVRVICEEPPTPLRQSWSGVRRPDRDLETIVGKSLEKEVDRRYGTAAELGDDVDRYLSSQPILARTPSAVYQLTKMVQRNRLGAAFAATVLLLLAAFAVTATVQSRAVAKQRDRAEEEAAKARAVSRFMADTLGAANPWGAGYDVTVVEALDQATEQIPTSFTDQPLVEAEVRHTVGTAFKNLGHYDRARPLLEEAEETRTLMIGKDDPETIATLQSLAETAWRGQHYDEAVQRAIELLDRQRRVYSEPSPEVAGTLEDLARILTDAGRFKEAEETIEQAISMNVELYGEHSLQVAACYENQATLVQYWQQDYALAEELNRKGLEIRRSVLETDTMDTASTLNNLGVVLLLQGRYDEALPVMEENIDILRRLAGNQHPELAKGLENLGNVYYRRQEFDRTLDLLAEVMEMRRDVLGDDSPEVARTLHNMGMVYNGAGQPEKAEASLRQAVAGMKRAYGPDHPDVASSYWSLAHVLWVQGKLDEAELELRAAVAVAEKAYPEGSPGRASYQLPLGNLLAERRRFTEAEPLVVGAHAAFLATDGPDAPRTVDAATWAVKLYEAWGRPDDAARFRPDPQGP
ncbi:MAG: serine/threonine-protein kinase [Thermoanaerobaculales bacterium]|jgi:serine/threonine protein kinase/Tfp pilus assembly protein PilF|nr:serine/threonine-protein kinase [Thermoanaerobaculales bacterium]